MAVHQQAQQSCELASPLPHFDQEGRKPYEGGENVDPPELGYSLLSWVILFI